MICVEAGHGKRPTSMKADEARETIYPAPKDQGVLIMQKEATPPGKHKAGMKRR